MVPNLDYVAHIQIACVRAISAPVGVILGDVKMFYAIKLFKKALDLGKIVGFISWLLLRFR